MRQLLELSKVFPDKFIHKNPTGFGDQIQHSVIRQRLLSVLGAYYLQSKTLDLRAICFAISIGLLCVGVLNLNNMRDIANDRNSKKNTLVVILGIQKSKLYHYSLIIISAITLLIGVGVNQLLNHQFYLLIYFPLLIHFFKVSKIKESKDYDQLSCLQQLIPKLYQSCSV